jgi:hypothetical protein
MTERVDAAAPAAQAQAWIAGVGLLVAGIAVSVCWSPSSIRAAIGAAAHRR